LSHATQGASGICQTGIWLYISKRSKSLFATVMACCSMSSGHCRQGYLWPLTWTGGCVAMQLSHSQKTKRYQPLAD